MSTPEHVAMIEATVARQRAFFQTGATRPVAVRVAALHKLKREMQARETILLDALYADLHKSHAEGYMCELGLNLDELGYLARKLPHRIIAEEGLLKILPGKDFLHNLYS